LRFRSVRIEKLRVRHTFKYLQLSFHACLTQFAVRTNGIAKD
jgi:hypothetical protein